MSELDQQERDCLARYCSLLAERLGGDLLAVQMFGSAARGDMGAEHSPMHSDIDLLIVTARELPPAEQEALTTETYPFYLECGRQISPNFVSQDSLVHPESERVRELLLRLRTQAVVVWPGPVTM
jgi:predicted nucleotidyltransferase